jgi:hypothetical protein
MRQLLPEPILQRAKKGFSSPLVHWMGAEREWTESFLRQGVTIVQPQALQALTGYAYGPKQWAALVLEQWARAN